jgi:hypothetical protein
MNSVPAWFVRVRYPGERFPNSAGKRSAGAGVRFIRMPTAAVTKFVLKPARIGASTELGWFLFIRWSIREPKRVANINDLQEFPREFRCSCSDL